MYSDSLSVLKKLSDEQAGKLFKVIAAYQNGEFCEMDLLTEIAFEPFRNYFERDDIDWKKTCEQNRLAGLKSAESRRNKSERPLRPANKRQRKPTNSTDNDNDSDNDKDNKNDSDNGNENIPTELFKADLKLPFDSIQFQDAWKTLLKQPKWKKKTTDALKVSLKKLSEVSEPDAIRMIQNSIEGSWQGLFPLKSNETPAKSEKVVHTDITQNKYNPRG